MAHTYLNLGLSDVQGSAGFGSAGVISGTVNLYNNALIDFEGGGQLTTLGTADLNLIGADAFIASGSATTSNSALMGFELIKGGNLSLDSGASVTTSGSLTLDTGDIYLDASNESGGSELDVGGKLAITGGVYVGSAGITDDELLVAASVDNTIGSSFDVVGTGPGSSTQHLAEAEIGSAASFSATAGVLTGNVYVVDDALILFEGGGQITKIASGDSLTLAGQSARIADFSNTSSKSALQGLGSIAGALEIDDDSVTTNGALTIASSGNLFVDNIGEGGGSLSVGGLLTNHDYIYLGNSGLTSASQISSLGLTNSGVIYITGGATASTTLDDTGKLVNSGVIMVGSGGILKVSGAVSNNSTASTGEIQIAGGGELYLSGAVSDDVIDFGGNGEIFVTGSAAILGGVLLGFSSNDTLDFTHKTYASTDMLLYAPNSGGTGGVVTVDTSHGVQVASFQVSGTYSQANFALGHDSAHHVTVSWQA